MVGGGGLLLNAGILSDTSRARQQNERFGGLDFALAPAVEGPRWTGVAGGSWRDVILGGDVDGMGFPGRYSGEHVSDMI